MQSPTHVLTTCAVCVGTLFTFLSTPLRGDELTAERIAALPREQQVAWQAYWQKSVAWAKQNETALKMEVESLSKGQATKAPDGGDFKLTAKPGDKWYASDEAKSLAATILSFQSPCGGWSKHVAYKNGPRPVGMQWTSQSDPGRPPHYLATFDNGSTTSQIHFLREVQRAQPSEQVKVSLNRAFQFILDAQFPSGGWPQVYPLEGGYHDNVTYNDDAVKRILELLLDVQKSPQNYEFLDSAMRQKLTESFDRGIDCVLNSQIESNGHKSVWCAQHDPITLKPSDARKMEPASISGAESSELLELLMLIDSPSPRVVSAIEDGLRWLDRAKIVGMSRVERDGKTTYERDPNSQKLYWARFYDLKTELPIFPGRDGIVYNTFAEMAAKNKVGYDYFTTRPESLLNTQQKKWRKKLK